MKVPWRGFLETKSGADFLRGIGVNYNVPGQSDLAVRLLAEAGFRAFRIEVGWGSVRWDESGLNDEDRLHWLLASCRAHASARPCCSTHITACRAPTRPWTRLWRQTLPNKAAA